MMGFGLDAGLIMPNCDRNPENLRLHVDRRNAIHVISNESERHRLFVLMKGAIRQAVINKHDVPCESLSTELTSFEPGINGEGCL